MQLSIPPNWEFTEIENVLSPSFEGKTLQQGWSPQCERSPSETEKTWGVLKTTAIQAGEFLANENKQLPKDLDPREHIEVQEGDLVMTCAGPRQRCGVPCLVPSIRPKLMMSGKMYRFRPVEGCINSKYVLFFLLSQAAQKAIDEMKTGISDSGLNLTQDRFRKLVLPVAPIEEQFRIVAKIEELFSELDKGIQSLKTAQQQLKIYRQSLLKAAFEGKLTEQWRKDNTDTLQPPEEFLREIRQEREDRHHELLKAWEGEVGKWQAAGKKGKKPAKPKPMKKIDSPSPSELEPLGALPLTWCWAKIGDVSSVGTGVTPLKSRAEFYEKGDIPWVTSGALNDNYVSEASGYVTKAALAETNLRLYPKHTLLMAMYGEGKTRGKCSELMLPATTNQAVAAMVQSGIEEETRPFLKWFLIKNYADIRRKSSGGVQPNLNLGIVENTFFPLCSIAEMREIDAELQRQLSVIEASEHDIDVQLDKSNALRQSILKKAFRGQLVKQDPDDEPASSLLHRISKQKEEAVALAKKAKAAAKKEPKRKAK